MSWLFAFLGAGLGFALGYAPELWRGLLLGLVSVASLLWSLRKKRWIAFLIALATGLLLGLLLYFAPYPSGKVDFDALVLKKGEGYVVVWSGFRRYYVPCKGNRYEVGDLLKIQGQVSELKMTTYESRFDFASYLTDLGARRQISNPKLSTVFATPFRIRNFEERFLNHFSGDVKALLDSLLFGKKDYGSKPIALADELNVLFVLSSSGFFYSAFLRGLQWALEKKMKSGADVVALLFGAMLLPFNVAKIGIVRAFLMRLIKAVDQHALKKDIVYLDRLGLSCLILGIDPFHFLNVGLWTGFGISACCYVSVNYFRFKSALLNRLSMIGVVRAFILPLGLSESGTLHLFAGAFTLLLLPFSFALLVLGYLGLVTYPIVPAMEAVANATIWLLGVLSPIDLSLPLPPLSLLGVGLFYVLFALTLYLTEIRLIAVRRAVLASALALYCVSLLPVAPLLSQSVSFVNVGQGDCSLIQDGLTTVMIDTGGNIAFDMAEECLIPYLRKRRIYKIDVLIATHQDYDHMGGVEGLMNRFNVGRYITSADAFPLRVGALTLHNHNIYEAKEENDSSLVLSLDFMDKKWLFTGDAPIWVERNIIRDFPELDCDVLKVGHHGSDTSTCGEFLDAVTPTTAIISCGAANKYGHPKASVLTLLQQRGIEVRRTDVEGTITYARIRR